jgi:hypothetical protein
MFICMPPDPVVRVQVPVQVLEADTLPFGPTADKLLFSELSAKIGLLASLSFLLLLIY